MKKSVLGMIGDQWTPVPPVATTDLSGKTVIVVGANTGLGFEATKHFAKMNPARLILACRNKEKGNAAVNRKFSAPNPLTSNLIRVPAEIRAETGCQTVELQLVDLCKFASVIAFAENFLKDGSRLDLLVANAGISTRNYKTTDDGWEETYVVLIQGCLTQRSWNLTSDPLKPTEFK